MRKVTKKELNERLLMVETLLGLHRALPDQISNDQANNAIFRMQCALSSGKELAERNPTEVEQRIEALEEFATYADNMLTELNHALPDPEYDAKCEAQEADIDASLDRHRERLGLNKPQLKQLDQSIFDGLDEKWRFAAVDGCTGKAYVYEQKPHFFHGRDYWRIHEGLQCIVGYDYNTSNWQNSLIERDIAKELTGSDLALELLKNQRYIIASVSDVSDADAIKCGNNKLIHKSSEDIFTDDMGGIYCWAVALNNQGEPLTAADVGL